MQVLVLDTSYNPVGVISPERAVTLILTGRAHTAHDSDVVWRSPSMMITVPSVIRLLAQMYIKRKRNMQWSKRGVMMRDGHICQFAHCGGKATTIEHLQPTSRGGEARSWENTVAACKACNGRKADKTLEEIGWKLRRKPKTPVGLMVATKNPPEEWAIYVPELSWRFEPAR
jgi:5-methylcytosine-specific restriction endonuclease McrA